MRYYISDLHFFHESLNHAMDCRGFENCDAMHEYMIAQWNNKVRKNDEVVILGDFSIGKADKTTEILQQLQGKKYLVIGNHDYFLNDKSFDRSLFQSIDYYKEMHDNNRKVILSHYPVMCYHGQNRVTNAGNPTTYMLYGHVHNTFDEQLINHFQNITRESERQIRKDQPKQGIPCNMINCFCMFSDYVPLTLDEWIENDKKRREKLPPFSID